MKAHGSSRFPLVLARRSLLGAALLAMLIPLVRTDATAQLATGTAASAKVPEPLEVSAPTAHGKLMRAPAGGLYGVMSDRDTANLGSVFHIAPSAKDRYILLHAFSGPDGAYPASRLAPDGSGVVYGTTREGGSSFADDVPGAGTLFRITPSGEHTVLHQFSGPDGANPDTGLLQDGDGHFYGTTSSGGSANAGTVFRLSRSGEHAVLHSFSGSGGAEPTALLIGADGNLYGTTRYSSGAGLGAGTVFRITPSGEHTVLHSFSGPDGNMPTFLIEGSDGNFYGVTARGGDTTASAGTVFRITPTGEYSRLHSFNGSDDGLAVPLPEPERDGAEPLELVENDDGSFFGITYRGGEPYAMGAAGAGTAFRITASGTYSLLHKFSYGSGTTGGFPTDLAPGDDGNYYGTTQYGGNANIGTLFRLTPSGEHAVLHSFSGTDGAFPVELAPGGDGNYYGITASSGDGAPLDDAGVVFRITPLGEFTVLPASAPQPGSNAGGGGGALDLAVLATLALLLLLRKAATADYRSRKPPSTGSTAPVM